MTADERQQVLQIVLARRSGADDHRGRRGAQRSHQRPQWSRAPETPVRTL